MQRMVGENFYHTFELYKYFRVSRKKPTCITKPNPKKSQTLSFQGITEADEAIPCNIDNIFRNVYFSSLKASHIIPWSLFLLLKTPSNGQWRRNRFATTALLWLNMRSLLTKNRSFSQIREEKNENNMKHNSNKEESNDDLKNVLRL